MDQEQPEPSTKEMAAEHIETEAHSRGSGLQTEKVTRTVLLFAVFIFVSATIVSFDLGYSGTVLLMRPFNTAFGPCQEMPGPDGTTMIEVCMLTPLQQSLTSLTQLFIGVGCLCTAITGHYIGRRGTIQVGTLVTMVGAAGMCGTSGSYLNYMVCKCINATGQGLLYVGGIIYGVECTPPHRRGVLLGFFTIGLALGTAIAAGVCAGTADIPNNWSWQTPIIAQVPLTLIIGTTVMFFPESPRWYLQKKKEEEARNGLGRFYHKDPHSAEIDVLIQEIHAYLDFEQEIATTTSWTEIFHQKNRRRTWISVWIMVATNLTGLQFVVPYAALFLGGIGVGSPFLINAIISLCFFAGSLFGGMVIDYAGRRMGLLAGFSIMATCMLIFSSVSSGLSQTSPIAQRVLVAFLCIWTFTFSAFIAPSAWVSSAEVHSLRLRSYGQGLTGIVSNTVSFAVQFWTPYMINPAYGNMGTNVGYFYFGLTVAAIIITFFTVPEMARLKLEQIDDYFESKIPAWRTSISRNKKLAAENVMIHTSTASPEALKG